MQKPYRNSFFTLTLVYTAFVVLTAILLMYTMPSLTVDARRGAMATLMIFLTPNICASVITAFRLRRYWSRLVPPGIVLISSIAAMATVVMLGAMSLTSAMITERNASLSLLTTLVLMLLPGAAAAQIPRFGWGIRFVTVPSDTR